jgi:hypothetical protein
MANRTAAFKRVAAKAPAKRSQRDSSAPATQTVVVKPAGKSPAKTAGKAPVKKTAARKAPARNPRG